jgi:excinuclease ABC subunit C
MNLNRLEVLREVVKEFPLLPGVYIMKSRDQKIIYIGKAKQLKNRVRSYFSDSPDMPVKTKFLIKSVYFIEYLVTQTELEALLLEAQLIKKHRPKYNIRLKDDKSYPYIKISWKDQFPRLYLARKVKNDGGFYFGPYPKGQVVSKTIRFLNENFKIRDCTDAVLSSRKRPCLSYQINRCTAPCVQLVSVEDYRKQVSDTKSFLLGAGEKIVADLENQMWQLADDEKFEQAARMRDAVEALKSAFSRQSVIKEAQSFDLDVLALKSSDRGVLFETLHVRKGVELGSRSFFFSIYDQDHEIKDLIVTFLTQYYEDNFIPDQLLLPIDLGSDLSGLMEQLLKERGKKEVLVRFAGDGFGSILLTKAQALAEEHFQKAVTRNQERDEGLKEIQIKLNLPDLPRRIECFDISTFQGQETVASQVVFEDGLPAKEHYRRYKIKSVKGIDDFAAMTEVLSRRFRHTEYEEPSLLVVDGGKGQLAIAVKVLSDLGLSHIPVVGLAKARTQSDFQNAEIKVTEERFYLPGRSNPVVFKPSSLAYQILVGARDEAHRFAITYHRKLREATSLESILDWVTGIGEKRKKALFRAFGDIEGLKSATVEQIAALPGFNRVVAEMVILQLQELESETSSSEEC